MITGIKIRTRSRLDSRFFKNSTIKKTSAKTKVILVADAAPNNIPMRSGFLFFEKQLAKDNKIKGTPAASTKYEVILIMLVENKTVEKTKNKASHKESILLNLKDLEIEQTAKKDMISVTIPIVDCGKFFPNRVTNGIKMTDVRGPKYI